MIKLFKKYNNNTKKSSTWRTSRIKHLKIIQIWRQNLNFCNVKTRNGDAGPTLDLHLILYSVNFK